MKKLRAEKKKIIDEHSKKLLKAYSKIEESINRAVKDSNTTGGGDLSLWEMFKAGVSLKWQKSLKMNSEDRLEFAKMEFDRSKNVFDVMKNVIGTGYESVIKDIDKQLKIYETEMAEIEKELKTDQGNSRHKELKRTKDKLADRTFN